MSAFEQELHNVTASLIRMLSLVRELSNLAKAGLIDADIKAAENCIANDVHIDNLQSELEQTILSIIARYQPTATDLRFLGAAHWGLVDIERAGDYAVHVARIALELVKNPPLKKLTDSESIFSIIDSMIELTAKAITESSVEIAEQAHVMDSEIDNLYEQIQRELLTHVLEEPKAITRVILLLNLARYLERLADHIENVNEHTIFWLTGKRP